MRQLKPVQMDWINYHLKRESDAMNGNKGGGGFRLENAADVPRQIFGDSSKAEGRPAGDFLGKT